MLSENGSYLTRRPSATISTKSGQSQATDLGISEPPNGSNSNTEGLSVVEEELPHNEQLERITMNKNHTGKLMTVLKSQPKYFIFIFQKLLLSSLIVLTKI